MGSSRRDRPIRLRLLGLLAVPLLSLTGIWGVTVAMTIGDSLVPAGRDKPWSSLRQPADLLITELQRERFTSATLRWDKAGIAALKEQRTRTDQARDRLRRLALTQRAAATADVRAQVDGMLSQIERLNEVRKDINGRIYTRLRTIQAYSAISDAIYRAHYALAATDDIAGPRRSRVVISLGYANELLTREQAIISVPRSGQMFPEERLLFTQSAGNRRFLLDQTLPELNAVFPELHVSLSTPSFARRLRLQEESIIAGVSPSARWQRVWQATSDDVAAAFRKAQVETGARLAERSEPAPDGAVLHVALAGGAGLLAIAVSILISLRFSSRLARELGAARHAALELATGRLPQVLERLRKDDDIDIASTPMPMPPAGATTEIQEVGRALATVHDVVVETAIGQVKFQRGVNQVFLNLARRSQSLLHRQRARLDVMQRRTTEPEALEDLFHLEHLTTRMRRHAEGLITLSGAAPGRAWRRPVPMHDVVRGAAAEVESYPRVTVVPMGDHALKGEAVADVLHLLAELIENATAFSPQNTSVAVRGELVGNGFAVEIEDRGLGVAEDRLAELNNRLASSPQFDEADSDHMGLFVAGRLASRWGIRATLRPSPYGGTTAIVLIPTSLVVLQEDPDLSRLNEEITPEDILLASMSRGATGADQSVEGTP